MVGAPVRILVVDSFEAWRNLVCSMLRGYAESRVVGKVADGLAAVQEASNLKPDLILLGIGLPKLNGIEAAKRIRRVAPGTKILFLTVNSEEDVAEAALSSGGQGYVLKTDAGNELLPAIEAVLHGTQYISSGLAGRFAATA
jgi:DNA-binding NarL/FixJ family response regulator